MATYNIDYSKIVALLVLLVIFIWLMLPVQPLIGTPDKNQHPHLHHDHEAKVGDETKTEVCIVLSIGCV